MAGEVGIEPTCSWLRTKRLKPFGHSPTETGARPQDLNREPLEYKTSALPIGARRAL